MLYNPPSGSTDANAGYVGKNVAGGTQGSKVPPAAVEYPQRELVALIAAAGLAPTNNVLVQGAIALGRGIWVDNLTGSGDLAVATLGVVLPSLLKGMRIGGVATAANAVTNPKLRVVNLGSVGGATEFPILKADGTALAVGEIKAGRIYRYEADGAGNVLISGGGIGGSGGVTPAALGAVGAPFNIKTFENTTRYSLSTTGDITVFTFGTYNKKSATSLVVAFLGAQSFVANGTSYSAAYAKLAVGGVTKLVTSNSYYLSTGGGPEALIGAPYAGLAVGDLAVTLAYGRADGQTWQNVINPNTTDSGALPASTASRLTLMEIEP